MVPLCSLLLAALLTPNAALRLIGEMLAPMLTDTLLDRVVSGSTRDLSRIHWINYQDFLKRRVEEAYPAPDRHFKILVVSPVKGSDVEVEEFEHTMQRLLENKVGDEFQFALFHYDEDDTEWMKREWYNAQDSPIVIKRKEAICKPMAWSYISLEMAEKYDYIWLMDGDLRLDMFSWDLYHSILTGLSPLVSQPSILPKRPGMRSTDKFRLRMVGRTANDTFPIAREIQRTEVMAPLVSTRLWPLLRERLFHSDLSTVWFHNNLWDMASHFASRKCGQTAALLVNAAPVRHLDFHDLLSNTSVPMRKFNCTIGCGENQANCRPMNSQEVQLLTKAMNGVCDVSDSPFLNCSTRVDFCRKRVADEGNFKEWVMFSNGTLGKFRYRCGYPKEKNHKTRRNSNCKIFS